MTYFLSTLPTMITALVVGGVGGHLVGRWYLSLLDRFVPDWYLRRWPRKWLPW